MPNNCDWYLRLDHVSREDFMKIRDLVRKNLFDKAVRPQPKMVRDDSRNGRLLHKAEEEYRKQTWHGRDKETRELAESRRPYKWLWYDRNCFHWGNKWWMCDGSSDYINHWRDWYEIQIYFWTARSPFSEEFIGKISSKWNCDVFYEYYEPWMNFSWRMWAKEWRVIDHDRWDDCCFGEWIRCENCWNYYSATDESEWSEGDSPICTYCADSLIHEFREIWKYNHIVSLIGEVDVNLPDDEYREGIIDKIYHAFSLSRAGAEYVFIAYNNWILSTNQWTEWERAE